MIYDDMLVALRALKHPALGAAELAIVFQTNVGLTQIRNPETQDIMMEVEDGFNPPWPYIAIEDKYSCCLLVREMYQRGIIGVKHVGISMCRNADLWNLTRAELQEMSINFNPRDFPRGMKAIDETEITVIGSQTGDWHKYIGAVHNFWMSDEGEYHSVMAAVSEEAYKIMVQQSCGNYITAMHQLLYSINQPAFPGWPADCLPDFSDGKPRPGRRYKLDHTGTLEPIAA